MGYPDTISQICVAFLFWSE